MLVVCDKAKAGNKEDVLANVDGVYTTINAGDWDAILHGPKAHDGTIITDVQQSQCPIQNTEEIIMTPREIVEAIYTTFNEGDVEGWKALCADDLVWVTKGRLPYSGIFNGPDDVIANCFSAIAENYPGIAVTPIKWWESGDSVWTTFDAKNERGSFDGAHLFRVANGKLKYLRAFDDTQGAAGLLA